jgi:hypothetical protein
MRRRKRKAGKVGKIGSVVMPTKPEESGGQATKLPHLATASAEEVNDKEAFRLCDEANACTALPIRVLNRPQWEQPMSKSAATAAVDDGNVSVSHAVMVASDGVGLESVAVGSLVDGREAAEVRRGSVHGRGAAMFARDCCRVV